MQTKDYIQLTTNMNYNLTPLVATNFHMRNYAKSKNRLQGMQTATSVLGDTKKLLQKWCKSIVDCMACCVVTYKVNEEEVYTKLDSNIQEGIEENSIQPETSCKSKTPPVDIVSKKDSVSPRKSIQNLPLAVSTFQAHKSITRNLQTASSYFCFGGTKNHIQSVYKSIVYIMACFAVSHNENADSSTNESALVTTIHSGDPKFDYNANQRGILHWLLRSNYDLPRGPLSTSSAKDFTIIGRLGSGGMGTVFDAHVRKRWYMARRFRDLGNVALKVMRKNFRFKNHMEEEVRNHMRFHNHPNVPTVHGCFQDTDYVCIIMEKLNGPDLYTYMKKGNNLFSEEQALVVMQQVLSVLSYMHGRRCAHLDIKPANVMFVSSPTGTTTLPRVQLIDFGLSLNHEPNTGVYDTMKIGQVGTPRQAAPEAAHFFGFYAAGPADMWSVGCLLYEMLSGTLPYEGETFVDVAIEAQRADDIFNSSAFKQLRPKTIGLLKTLLSVNPDQRPSAADSLELVEHILQHFQPSGHVDAIPIMLE